MSSQRSARALADVNGGIILAEVEIAAPPERVFRALTQSDEIVRWWGSPDAYRTESWTADLRVGGSWKADGRGSDGASFTVGGVFLGGRTVEAGRRGRLLGVGERSAIQRTSP